MSHYDVIRFEICLGLILCIVLGSLATAARSRSDETCVRRPRRIMSYDFDFGPPRKTCCGCCKNRDDDAYTEWMLSYKKYKDPFAVKLSLKTMRQKRAEDPRLKHVKDEL